MKKPTNDVRGIRGASYFGGNMKTAIFFVEASESKCWNAVSLPQAFSFIYFKLYPEGLLFSENGKDYAPAEFEPTTIPTLLSASKTSGEKHKKILSLLKGMGYGSGVKFLSLQPEGRKAPSIERQLLDFIAEQITPFMEYSCSLSQALYANRKAYVELQQRFADAESFLLSSCGNKLMRCKADFPLLKTTRGDVVSCEFSSGVLIQSIPVASSGICGIELFIENTPKELSKVLTVSLFVGDASSQAARWIITQSSKPARNGEWKFLALPHALDGIPQPLRLEMTLDDTKRAPVRIGLSQPLANPDFCPVNFSDTREMSSPLALRLWESVRGAQTPLAPNMILPENQDVHTIRQYHISDMLRHAHATGDCNWAEGWDPVLFDEDIKELVIHPPPEGITCAMLDEAFPKEGTLLSLTARVAHEQSADVEFAVCIGAVSADDVKEMVNNHTLHHDNASWSGWVAVSAMAEKRISVIAPANKSMDVKKDAELMPVYVMTRMAGGVVNDYAWARIKDMVIDCKV